MRFEALGPLRVSIGDRTLAPGSPQQRKLLALLLAAPNQVTSTDRLIDEMWGDAAPASARHLVQDYVWRLRNLFGDTDQLPRIVREGSGYAIRVDRDEFDVLQLEAALDEAAQLGADDPSAVESLVTGATKLWRGTPFGALAAECPSLQSACARLEELHLSAVEALVEARMQLGHHRELVGELEVLTERHPYREHLWELLMSALYRSGRQAEALRACHTLRNIIGEELGLEPSPAIQTLERRIRVHDPELQWAVPEPTSNLPTRLTSFVGRTDDLATVAKLMDTARLVTLIGPGGIGKTRLAVEVADRLLTHFPDGVCWIDLGPVDDPEMVGAVVGDTLGVTPQPGVPLAETISRSLVRRRLLLVFDNCEHLAPAVADVVDSILHGTALVNVLATSRIPLRVSGEMLWPVPALGLPPIDKTTASEMAFSDAIRLFLDRASAVEPTFHLVEDNAGAVAAICHRLDGIPLAIEMASARLRVLTPAQIAAALDDRFELLTSVEHGTDARHQTLEATLDWGYQLLDPELRSIFDRLAMFAGTFDLDAVGAVACRSATGPSPLDAVAGLVDASMVTTVTATEPVARYRLLETLRSYAHRQLAAHHDEGAVRAGHAEYFLGLAIRADEVTGTPAFAARIEQLWDAYPDLRQALSWSLEHRERAETLRAAPTLFHFWFRTGNAPESLRWGNRMLDGAEEVPGPLRAAAHMAVSFGANILRDPDRSRTHAEVAIELYRQANDRRGLATALFGLGAWAIDVGDMAVVRASCEEALEIWRELGDRWGRAGPLAQLSFVHLFGGGSLDEARHLAEEALSLNRQLGDTGSQVVMNPLSVIALRQGDLATAERCAVDAAAIATGTGWEATALVNLAAVFIAAGDTTAGEATLRRALKRALDTGLENWFRIALRDLAGVALTQGDPHRAARLNGASRRNMPHYGLDPAIYEALEAGCRSSLAEQEFANEMGAGFEMTHEQLIDLTLGTAPTT